MKEANLLKKKIAAVTEIYNLKTKILQNINQMTYIYLSFLLCCVS